MSDTKISALTALAEVLANDDVLPFVDTSVTTTKKVTSAYMRRFKVDAVVITGSLTPNALQLVTLNLGSAIALTISGSPTIGDVLIVNRIGSGVTNHTVVLGSGIDWDASGNGTATLADDGDTLIAIAISTTRWLVVYNNGVTFSA